MRRRLASVMLGLSVAVALTAGAQQREPGRTVFRSGIELVNVTATVLDSEGRLVDGLTAADFELYEDREARPVTYFSRERVPVSLGLVLDASDSMYGQRIAAAREALNQFLLDLLEPTDEAFLLVFNHRPMEATAWTPRPRRLSPKLDAVRPRGGTALYDAMLAALPRFDDRQHQRAAIVLVSDGADTASDHAVREVRDQLRRSEAFVYALAIDTKERVPINDRVNPYALREITDESGGYTEVVRDPGELASAARRIAEELNHQYSLGYNPSKPPDGRYRRIRVRVIGREYTVRARRGYVAAP